MGSRRIKILRIIQRIYAFTVLAWCVTVVTLAFILDGDIYGAVLFESLITLLSLSIPLFAIAITIECFKLGTKPIPRVHVTDHSERLQIAVKKLSDENEELRQLITRKK